MNDTLAAAAARRALRLLQVAEHGELTSDELGRLLYLETLRPSQPEEASDVLA